MPTPVQLLAPTAVRTRCHGTFLLRGLSLHDTIFLASLCDKPLSNAAFAAAVIENQLVQPRLSLQTLKALPPAVLAHVGRVWLRKEEHVVLDGSLPPLAAFRMAVQSCVDGWATQSRDALTHVPNSLTSYATSIAAGFLQMANQQSAVAGLLQIVNQQLSVASVVDSVAASAAAAIQSVPSAALSLIGQSVADLQLSAAGMLAAQMQAFNISQGLQGFLSIAHGTIFQAVRTLQQAFDLQRYFDLEGLFTLLERLQRDVQTFEDSEYGFVAHLLPLPLIVRLASVDPRVRHAVSTRTLRPHTRSCAFEEQMCVLFAQGPMLSRRWRIVQQGLRHHQDGDYISSIRILMPEVDGIYADMLIARKRVRESRKKLYALDDQGKLKLTKLGKPEELRGVGRLVQHYRFPDHPVMARVAQHLERPFAPERNPNLHGRVFAYDTPMLSIQIVLLLFVMAQEFLPEGTLTSMDSTPFLWYPEIKQPQGHVAAAIASQRDSM